MGPRVQQGRFQPPRAYSKHAPKAMQAVCLKAMARKAPSESFESGDYDPTTIKPLLNYAVV